MLCLYCLLIVESIVVMGMNVGRKVIKFLDVFWKGICEVYVVYKMYIFFLFLVIKWYL